MIYEAGGLQYVVIASGSGNMETSPQKALSLFAQIGISCPIKKYLFL